MASLYRHHIVIKSSSNRHLSSAFGHFFRDAVIRSFGPESSLVLATAVNELFPIGSNTRIWRLSVTDSPDLVVCRRVALWLVDRR